MPNKKLSKYQTKHIQYVKNKVAKAIMDYSLIEKGEKVLVGVSGGKDSLVLIEVLSAIREYDFLEFNLHAIHIDVEEVPYKVSREKISQICKNLGVPIEFVDIKTGLSEESEKSPCFICSWHRRKSIFNYAQKNGFTKVALGHHMDDAVETLLINMAYHGNISSIPQKLSMFNDKLVLIRPLMLLTNKDTAEYSNIRNYPKQSESCPYEDKTKRNTSRELIQQLKKIHPKALQNIYGSMSNIDQDYLPKGVKKR